MKKKVEKAPGASSKRFNAHKLARHRKLLAELPAQMEARQQNIFNRNQMLAATQAYNLKLEKERTQGHLTSLPNGLQRVAAMEYIGDLDRKIHRLAQTGLP